VAEALPGEQTAAAAAACARAVTEVAAARQASPASSDVAARTPPDEVVALPHHLAVVLPKCVLLQPPQALFPRPAAREVARSSAVLPADASPERAAVPVAVSCPVLRFEGESSAARTVPSVVAEQLALLLRQGAEVLRLSPRQPAVLRSEALRAQSRLEVLHRLRLEVEVRLRQRVVAPQRQPGLRQALRRPAAVEQRRAPRPRPARAA
jgi:hypothetical protein